MSFESFRDKAQRVALGSALVLFIGDWICRVSFWRINEQGWGETNTPGGVVQVWLLLLLATFLLGLITLPRWQSFLALLSVARVVLMAMQGHWPGA